MGRKLKGQKPTEKKPTEEKPMEEKPMDKKSMDKKSILECFGGGLIVLCAIGVLCSFVIACILFSNNSVQDVKLQIALPIDSTGILTKESIQQIEELKVELVRHEQLLEDRYQHVLEQKENLNDLLTIGGMFLTIILSLFGFFGYKSMTTLEEKVKQDADLIAETTAKETARETSKSKFADFEQSTKTSLESKMLNSVTECVKKEVSIASNRILEATSKEVEEEFNTKIEDIFDNLSGITTSLENLNDSISKLKDRVSIIEASNINPPQGRRSLRNGGNIK